ncbi:MAG: tyrosine-type recombinase/integrase [Pirellulales bacterium]
MSNDNPRIPSYRLHKPSGRAVVTIDGRDVYLGKFGSLASRREYNRVIAEWTAQGAALPKYRGADLTIVELAAAFLRHARLYHSAKERENFALAIRPLKELYARSRAAEFGPLALKAVRQTMIDAGLARTTINRRVNRIRHIFKWAAENELVDAYLLHGLQAVAGLRAGRTKARESEPVRPVAAAFVDAVLPFVAPQVAAMIELQCATGMRSGEVTAMRACDINMTGRVWVYTPQTHKTAWRGHARRVYLGPKAQAIIKPFLKADLAAYLFSPADAEAVRHDRRFGAVSATRKTKVYPCELRRRESQRRYRQAKQRTRLRDRYDTHSYRRAVAYGIEQANKARLAAAAAEGVDVDQVKLVPSWHPHQLRHNAATALRREYGLEVARIVLGHRSPAITEVYAEVDHTRAIDVMAKIG